MFCFNNLIYCISNIHCSNSRNYAECKKKFLRKNYRLDLVIPLFNASVLMCVIAKGRHDIHRFLFLSGLRIAIGIKTYVSYAL